MRRRGGNDFDVACQRPLEPIRPTDGLDVTSYGIDQRAADGRAVSRSNPHLHTRFVNHYAQSAELAHALLSEGQHAEMQSTPGGNERRRGVT